MQHKIKERGLNWTVDSAGTGDWHSGDLPDRRSIETAHKHGIDLSHQRARQIRTADFEAFDHILVMDASNYQNVSQLTQNEAHRAKIELILNYASPGRNQQVPDPYYGGDEGFELVFLMLDLACEKFLEHHT
jgi:protein-tyrosine phosphatase